MAVDEDDSETPDIDELSAADAADMKLQDVADDKESARAWIHACLAVIGSRTEDLDIPFVQQALDQMRVDAAERIGRLLRADLGSTKPCA